MNEKEKKLNNEEEIKDDNTQKLEQEIEETKNQNEDFEKLKDQFLRLQADFTNYKRRQEKEKQDIYKYASEKLVTKLLYVLDNLDRALAEVKEHDAFSEGIELVRKEFTDILKQEGLEEIESDGQPFDANLHHAVLAEDSEEFPAEHIIETLQKGYKLKDKVIRPAMVKVSRS